MRGDLLANGNRVIVIADAVHELFHAEPLEDGGAGFGLAGAEDSVMIVVIHESVLASELLPADRTIPTLAKTWGCAR